MTLWLAIGLIIAAFLIGLVLGLALAFGFVRSMDWLFEEERNVALGRGRRPTYSPDKDVHELRFYDGGGMSRMPRQADDWMQK